MYSSPGLPRLLGAVALTTCAALTFVQLGPLLRPDPRDRALDWLAPQVRPGSAVGLVGIPWFTHPPVTTWNGGERTRTRYESGTPVRIVACEDWDPARLGREAPEWFLISEFDVREELRLGDARALEFLGALEAGWDVVASFEGMPASRRRLFGGHAPHDWLYPYANVKIYRRRAG